LKIQKIHFTSSWPNRLTPAVIAQLTLWTLKVL